MLTWDDSPDPSGKLPSYTAHIPHWGEARVYPCAQHLGEMFLECPGLGIKAHPLGRTTGLDALNPAEMTLMRALAQHGAWCLAALVAIGCPEE